MSHEVWITGIGLLSSLGEGNDAHWAALTAAAPRPVVDEKTWAPYAFHPLAPVDYDRHIPKKGDQRQMEPWQRIGTYAAGLALADAGVAGQAALLARTHMVVAAGGGERDLNVDLTLSHEFAGQDGFGAALNARLGTDLRPTLFLAQLSNLLAGSISIVHGVRGSSRTFMGEESSGADAARIAHARLAAGQAELALVGGALSGTRPDLMMLYRAGGMELAGTMQPVWQRAGAGFAMGSLGAFLVMETREHAEARGAHRLARIRGIASDTGRRAQGAAAARAAAMWEALRPPTQGTLGVISGAPGSAPAHAEECAFLDALAAERRLAVRASGTMLGHGVEAAFPANLALAALAIARGGFYPPFEPGPREAPAEGAVSQILVTGFGQWRGEALALLDAG